MSYARHIKQGYVQAHGVVASKKTEALLWDRTICFACGRATLRGTEHFNKFITTPLYLLCDQPGLIRAYKLVNAAGQGVFRGGITYEVGHSYTVDDADMNEHHLCAPGINLATLDWCLREWQPSDRILIAEFTAKDIAVIPVASDGKFRVHHCVIVGEKQLEDVGIVTNKTPL